MGSLGPAGAGPGGTAPGGTGLGGTGPVGTGPGGAGDGGPQVLDRLATRRGELALRRSGTELLENDIVLSLSFQITGASRN